MQTTTIDPTEAIRRVLVVQINTRPADRAALESRYGRVWSTTELQEDFEVLDFQAPLVVVRRKSDDRLGSLFFQHQPRFYFDFKEDE